MRIYIGNLSSDVTEDELRKVFQAFGQVSFVKISMDLTNNTPINFGLVGMAVPREAKAAIAGLHGKELKGTVPAISEAGVHPRQVEVTK
jgi:RNA recognition motif-containing protein